MRRTIPSDRRAFCAPSHTIALSRTGSIVARRECWCARCTHGSRRTECVRTQSRLRERPCLLHPLRHPRNITPSRKRRAPRRRIDIPWLTPRGLTAIRNARRRTRPAGRPPCPRHRRPCPTQVPLAGQLGFLRACPLLRVPRRQQRGFCRNRAGNSSGSVGRFLPPSAEAMLRRQQAVREQSGGLLRPHDVICRASHDGRFQSSRWSPVSKPAGC